MRALLSRSLLGFVFLTTTAARASSFDEEGRWVADPEAVFVQSFETDDGTALGIDCTEENSCTWSSLADELPLSGERYVRASAQQSGFRVAVTLPAENRSYRVAVWVRHARVSARIVAEYTEESARPSDTAYLFPTGRVTSDGWVELVTNPMSITGRDLDSAYVRIEATDVDVDAIEIVPEGEYDAGGTCFGAFDPVCGPEAICVGERCRPGRNFVPPLPAEKDREAFTKYLISRVQKFFGGKLSRAQYLPSALAKMSEMSSAQTPWQYWGAFAHGVRLLHDWHTSMSSAIEQQNGPRRLGVCFIEGEADLTQTVWPSTVGRADILVANVGPEATQSLVPGDRLVAVDGEHPIDWAKKLLAIHWGFHVATDPNVDADLAESMRGLITRYAKSFSVIRCQTTGPSCASTVETISVKDLATSGEVPSCDNRPSYHLDNPPESTGEITVFHQVPFFPWQDRVSDSPVGEDIYGMTFDNLYGPVLTPSFQTSNQFFRDNARGVILDHRAGNGGTIDAPQALTELIRPTEENAASTGFMEFAGYDGPQTPEEGVALWQHLKSAVSTIYTIGSANPDLELPVALIIHRDGSASDWLPLGFKGAPNARVFGPHQTAGAFSSFYQFGYWSRIDFQLASGDTILPDGSALIGHGVEPDEIVNHTQTSLLSGKDLPYEAALAWVRKNLKP
jgi:hypothetical protein